MSIIQAYNEAWEMGDAEKLEAIIHDDCVFNPPVGGKMALRSLSCRHPPG